MSGDLDPIRLSIKLSLLGAVTIDFILTALRTFYGQSITVLSLEKEGWDTERPQLEVPLENKALASSDPKQMEKDLSPFFLFSFPYFFASRVFYKRWDCWGQGRNSE